MLQKQTKHLQITLTFFPLHQTMKTSGRMTVCRISEAEFHLQGTKLKKLLSKISRRRQMRLKKMRLLHDCAVTVLVKADI